MVPSRSVQSDKHPMPHIENLVLPWVTANFTVGYSEIDVLNQTRARLGPKVAHAYFLSLNFKIEKPLEVFDALILFIARQRDQSHTHEMSLVNQRFRCVGSP